MGFRLGNYNIDEILYGVSQNFNDDILYTLDQLSNASIEISADPTEIKDKNGNVVRTIYKTKTGKLSAKNAFLHVELQNAASGSNIETASLEKPIDMPKIEVVAAGKTLDITDAVEGTIHVIGLYGNGANGKNLTQSSSADYTAGTFGVAEHILTVPAAKEDDPIQYLVKYQRKSKSGIKLTNTVNKFPDTQRMTFFCSYMDPCSDGLKPCYVYLPSFMPDPSVTVSLDREAQEMDFNGTLQIDYCATDKPLYYIFFPGDESVYSGAAA